MRTRPARRARWVLLAGIAAVVLAAALVVIPLAIRGGDGPPYPGLPQGSVRAMPTRLADGSNYSLRSIVDPDLSVGVAVTPDGLTYSIVVVAAGRVTPVRELRSDQGPAFDGFVWYEGSVFWTEATVTVEETDRVQLWVAEVGEPVGQPRLVVEEMGAVQFDGSAHDLVIADAAVSWSVATQTHTLVRTVAVTGGEVAQAEYPGLWRSIDWPWLVSAQGPTVLFDPRTGERVTVPGSDTAATECTPQACRATVASGDETVRLEFVAPDGSQRSTIAGPRTTFAAVDPWPLDRYELISETGGDVPPGQRWLLLYDRTDGSTRFIEGGPATTVTVRDGWAWWLAGETSAPVWHMLDLAALAGADRTA